MVRTKKSGWYCIAAMIIPGLLLQGCTSNSVRPDTVAVQKTHKGPILKRFLSDGQKGDVRQFVQTPWGEDVLVRLGENYFSASGKRCRRIMLGPVSDKPSRWIAACEDPVESLSVKRSTSDMIVQNILELDE